MNTTQKIERADYSGNFAGAATMGAGGGGLVNMGDALELAGVPIDSTTDGAGAGVAYGWQAMTVAQALATCEHPAGPLLRAVQEQIDIAISARSVRKLAMRMAADGHEVSLDRQGDAVAAACHALVCWRAGVTIERVDGADVMRHGAVVAGLASRIAWRAAVDSLSCDNFGVTIPLLGGAEDNWLTAQALPSESFAERSARRKIENQASNRQERLRLRMAGVSGGRGRRAAAIDKVRNVCGLILAGESLEVAAAAAGFKMRGRNYASDSFLQAAKRLKLIPGGFTARMRSRSEAGLKRVVSGDGLEVGEFGDMLPVIVPFKFSPVLAGGSSVVEVQPVRVAVGAGDACLAQYRAARSVARFEWSRMAAAARFHALPVRARQSFISRAVRSFIPGPAIQPASHNKPASQPASEPVSQPVTHWRADMAKVRRAVQSRLPDMAQAKLAGRVSYRIKPGGGRVA